MLLYKRFLREYTRKYEISYETICSELKEVRRLEDLVVLRGASLVAMTTTGAAKFHSLLQVLIWFFI